MRSIKAVILVIFALSASQIKVKVEGAKILAIFAFPGPSQYILVQPYLKTLAARGHEVTVINAFPQKKPIKNFRDIPVLGVFDDYDDLLADAMTERGIWRELSFFGKFLKNITLKILQTPEVQQLINSNEQFDLVIIETLQTDALYGFAQHYNAPIIGVSSFGTDRNMDELVGNVSPISYIPLVTSGLTDKMNFVQRLKNLARATVEWLHYHTIHLPEQVEIYKKHFPHAKVELMELRKQFSLMLLNQHFSLSFPRPYVPNMIEVGGFHLHHKPAPLPLEMEAFINASTQGVIYFSMGSNIKSKDLPKDKLDIILKTFASLPQHIMWKFEDPNLPGKPDNVFISKWFPQPDILAHPKVKLFITHSGLLSTIEAIYHGKPVVGIPMFYDQFLNIERAKSAGFGLGVDFNTLNSEDLKQTIERVLKEPSFTEVATKMSQRYRDQPMTPLDTAIYWTEYVLRHDGASHMRVAAQDLSFVAYNSLDTIAVIFGSISLTLILLIVLIYKIVNAVFVKKNAKLIKQKQQ